MIEIRWLLRGSDKVLQYRYRNAIEGFSPMFLGWSDWQDVPIVVEVGRVD